MTQDGEHSVRQVLAVATFLVAFSLGCRKPDPVAEIRVSEGNEIGEDLPIAMSSGDWPWWRGPGQSGVSGDSQIPTRWSSTENMLWKRELPGSGHASPIICGDKILLATADEQEQTQSVLAFDRETGTQLWSTDAHKSGLMKKHQKNSHASATLACDGEQAYAAFINDGGLHVTAIDLNGEILWQTDVGPFNSEHGYGSAPVLFESLVIVNGDNLSGSFVAAVHRGSGKIVWRTRREGSGRHGSYATPIVAELSGKPQLLLTGLGRTVSYDPRTGSEIWTVEGPAEVTGNTPAVSESLAFVSGGYPEKEIVAVRTDGEGDVSKSHVAWRVSRGATYVPSPLYHNGLLYVVSDNGIATCFEADSGDQVWQERLQGSFTASPVLVDDRIIITNEAGRTFVLRAGREFEVLAENDLGERTLASPAVSNGKIFLRTEQNLYCLSEAASSAP